MYSLWLGLVPDGDGNIESVWQSTTRWGMEHIGDFGMFAFMKALAAYPAGDGGEAALKALTKCDEDSWCHEIRGKDATMTRESAYDNSPGTMSHGWGASTVAATVETLVGLRQTAPAWSRAEVKPRLGGMEHVSVKVPTPYGSLMVNATKGSVDVILPCNTRASLCIATAGRSFATGGLKQRLMLDGASFESSSLWNISTRDRLAERAAGGRQGASGTAGKDSRQALLCKFMLGAGSLTSGLSANVCFAQVSWCQRRAL